MSKKLTYVFLFLACHVFSLLGHAALPLCPAELERIQLIREFGDIFGERLKKMWAKTSFTPEDFKNGTLKAASLRKNNGMRYYTLETGDYIYVFSARARLIRRGFHTNVERYVKTQKEEMSADFGPNFWAPDVPFNRALDIQSSYAPRLYYTLFYNGELPSFSKFHPAYFWSAKMSLGDGDLYFTPSNLGEVITKEKPPVVIRYEKIVSSEIINEAKKQNAMLANSDFLKDFGDNVNSSLFENDIGPKTLEQGTLTQGHVPGVPEMRFYTLRYENRMWLFFGLPGKKQLSTLVIKLNESAATPSGVNAVAADEGRKWLGSYSEHMAHSYDPQPLLIQALFAKAKKDGTRWREKDDYEHLVALVPDEKSNDANAKLYLHFFKGRLAVTEKTPAKYEDLEASKNKPKRPTAPVVKKTDWDQVLRSLVNSGLEDD